jgi:hypothetical protein
MANLELTAELKLRGMYLSEDDPTTYLANAIFVAHADGGISPKMAAALQEIRNSLGVTKPAYELAAKRALSGAYSLKIVSTFAGQVNNIADMLYLSAISDNISTTKIDLIYKFSKSIALSDEQIRALTKDAINRRDLRSASEICPACHSQISADSRFCPKCGFSLASTNLSELEIPAVGYAIEFCESTSATFASALSAAQKAQSFSSCQRNKKTWYLASWPENAFSDVVHLAGLLNGLKNKKCYLNTRELDWSELFGFIWCAGERGKAYSPVEYCFGKSNRQLNPWGCIQAHMDWTEWAKWFSYGHFEKQGAFRSTQVWTFDKDRIRHELMIQLQRFRYCPHLRMSLVEAVLKELPDRVKVSDNGAWRYNRAYEEAPGSIKVVEVKKSADYEYRDEYFADGVRPRGTQALSEIIMRAFTAAGITDLQPAAITD